MHTPVAVRGRTRSTGSARCRRSTAWGLVGAPRALRLVVRAELDQRQPAQAVGAEVLAGRERQGEVRLAEGRGHLGDALDRLVDLLRIVAAGLLDSGLEQLNGVPGLRVVRGDLVVVAVLLL